jgi:hypothetical protein
MKKSELQQIIRKELKNALNESTIVHKTVTGDIKKLNIDLKPFDAFLMSLQPIIGGREYQIDTKTREDILNYIVKYLGGYSSIGGGTVKVR